MPNERSLIENERLRRELATKDFNSYVKYVRPDFIVGWFNKTLNDIIQQFVDDCDAGKSPRVIVTTPPRHGKTEAVTRCLATYYAASHPKSQSIFVTHTDSLSADNGADARAIYDSSEFSRVFDTKLHKDHRSREDMRLLNGSKIKFAGIGSGLPGYGGEVIVVDDYFRNNEEADSQTQRDSVFKWLQGTLFNRVHPGGGIIITATRWHVDDPIGRLLKQPDCPWKLVEFPAIAKKDEPFRRTGAPLHPERWPLEHLNTLKRDSGPRIWASLYQCSPYIETGNFFNVKDFSYYDVLPDNLSFAVGADYATSNAASADHSAIVPGGMDANLNVYIPPDFICEKLDPREAVTKTVRMCKKYDTRIICHEKGVIANLLRPVFDDVMMREKYFLVTERYTRTSAKHVYAMTIKSLQEAGRLHFHRSCKDRIESLLLPFDPKSSGPDDFVDALASLCLMISNSVIPVPLPTAPEPRQQLTPVEERSNYAKQLYEEHKRAADNDNDDSDGW